MPQKPIRKVKRRHVKLQCRSNGTDNYLSYERLEPRQLLAALPIITEFSASNQSVIFDGNGAAPDWIEVFNNGDQSLDLAGYSLTDDPQELNKWVFPNQTLGAGEYLVVFASGDAIPDPSGNLHTNFSLSAGGEYLALSDPGGTVLSEFGSSTTDFPAQQGDESFGLAFNSSVTEVVTPTSSAQYFIPTDASVDAFWTSNGFDDSAWQTGSASIGYEENPADFDDLIITQVPVGTTSLYSRITFEVTDPDTLLSTLQMRYDDGFIAYLNGTRIASDNAPITGAYDSLATGQHADSLAVNFVDFDISQFSDSLVVGTNTLAIHLLNRSSGSSDFLLVPNLITTAGSPISPAVQGQLVSPTPGQPNTNVTASAVEFSRAGGTFFNAFQLALTSSGQNETIRFTTDGSQPTASSPVYTAPISLIASVQIRARAFGSVGQEGPIVVESYSLTDSATNDFTSDLPIIVIENYGAGDPGDGDFEPAALSLYDVDDISGRSSLSGNADVSTLIGQHRRGSSTLNNPKPNLRIETRDPLGEDQNVSWLGLPAESDWILTGPYRFDRALIRDTLLHDLSNQTGNYAVRTRFVEVYGNFDGGLLTNGDYLGVYFLTETVKIDDDRVDIARLDTSDNTAPDITGGYILRIDRGGQFETSRGVPNRGGASFVHVSPDPQELTSEQTDYIRGYVQDLEDALYGPNSTDPELGYEAFLDVEASIDHHIFRTLSLEPDSLGLSTFLTKDRDGKLAFGPLWDSDRSQGSDNDLRSSDPEVWFSGVDFFEFDWWGELFNDPDFKQQWVDRWQELRQTTFSDANILATLNGQAAELVEAQARNFARWPEVAPNGGEFAQPGLTGWEAEVSHLAGWLMARVDWIDSRLIAAPTLGTNPGNVSAGTQITLNQTGAAIFYTLDGTDPRAEGGGISPSAILYTGPLTVNATTQVISRAMDIPTESVGQTPGTSPWSQAVEGLFSVEAPASSANLAISELHYHPADPTAAELLEVPGTDDDDFEFIELINVSDDAISLNGVTLQDAVSFDFTTAAITSLAPGETVLVVNNVAAFEARYGTGFAIAGEYSGRFSNNSERVMVIDSLDQAIVDFTYSDSNPWPVEADGDGPSLELIDASGDHGDPANWRLSLTDGGTPGVAPVAVAPQVVSSVRDGGSIARPDLLGTVAFTFSQDVNVDAADLIVQNDTLGGLVVDTSGVGFSYDAGTRSATWDFGSLVLDAAFYTFQLSSNITSVAGGLALDGNGDGTGGDDSNESVYVAIPGDRNLDGVVDSVDVDTTIANLITTQGAVWADGDFNGDGAVTVIADVLTMTGNLNRSVVPPAASPIQFDDGGSEVAELTLIPDEAQAASEELDVVVADEADNLLPLSETADSSVPQEDATPVVPTEVVSVQSDEGPIEVEDIESPVVANEIQSSSFELGVDATVEAEDLVLLEPTTNMPASLVAASFLYQPTSFQPTLTAPLSASDYQTSILAGSVVNLDSDHNLLLDYSDEFYLAQPNDENQDATIYDIDTLRSSATIDEAFAQLDE